MLMNKNFYPTPSNVIIKMTSGIKFDNDICKPRILEPSAGKGDILDYLEKSQYYYKLFCIEKDPELAHILRDKGYNFLDDDFLTYTPDCTFDAIIMNPPFDNGVKHFLKAWEISSNTHIRCLLPEETLLNPYTEERKLLKKIIEDNDGTIERLGDCFKHAERKTNVDVVLISIYKKEKSEQNFDFNKHFDQEKVYNLDDLEGNAVANTDVFGNLELRYNKVRESIKKMIELKNEVQYYGQDLIDHNVFSLFTNDSFSCDAELFNNICDKVREQSWSSIFSNTKMGNVVTTKTRKKIDTLQSQQGHMAFTAKNMEKLYSDLFQNMGSIMHDCVVESFDLLTKYYKENRCHVEGWVTNERFFVNKKFILPYSIDTSWLKYQWDYAHIHYSRSNDLVDIEKAICFITGKQVENINSIAQMFQDHTVTEFGKWYDSEFFEFKCFKKGTMHFKFKDEKLWNKFNVAACKGKNWIGF